MIQSNSGSLALSFISASSLVDVVEKRDHVKLRVPDGEKSGRMGAHRIKFSREEQFYQKQRAEALAINSISLSRTDANTIALIKEIITLIS